MQGFSEIFSKLDNKKSTLVSNDLSARQKEHLYAIMARYGATQGFSYDRFFQNGFVQWELIGIDAIKRQFLAEHDIDIFGPGSVADALSLRATLYNTPGSFYELLCNTRGLRTDFYQYMSDLGMMSNTTVLNRFKADNWLAWERRGLHAIIEEFINEEEKSNSI